MCKVLHPPCTLPEMEDDLPVCQEDFYWFKMPSVYPEKSLTRPSKYDQVQSAYAPFPFM